MNNFFIFTTYAEFPFQMFSMHHVIPLGLIGGLVILIYIMPKRLREPQLNSFVRYAMAGLLFLQEASYHVWAISNGAWHAADSLPLHLCGLSAFLSGVMLLTRRYSIFEVVYFWGLAGATQALLTPDLGDYSFPHYVYYKFFVSHGLIVLAVFFMIFVEGYRPTLATIGKVVLITNVYAVFIGAINYLSGGNYLYLCAKPQGSSLLDYLGPWPWYIASLEAVMVLSCLVCYLPYLIRDIVDDNKRLTFGRTVDK